MLKWEKDINGYNGHWMGGYIGFDDDCPLYKVGEDDDGWYYEYLPDADGMIGYDTAKEAMTAAEAEFQHWNRTTDGSASENDFDLLEELTSQTELENWMGSITFTVHRSDWD